MARAAIDLETGAKPGHGRLVAPTSIHRLTSDELKLAAQSVLCSGAGMAAKIYRQVFQEGRFAPQEFGMAARSVESWQANFCLDLPQVKEVVHESGEMGTTAKAVLRLSDGYEVECVYIPMGGERSSLCVSSQVGCKMGCTFCETGRMGLLRHLQADEIIGQMLVARYQLGWAFRNVVFMGMGEALDNADQVFRTIRVSNDRLGLQMAQDRFTVCTVGSLAGIARFVAQGLKRVNLSVSLNAGDDRTRSQIMPVNRQTSLDQLALALAAYRPRPNFVLGVNYCLLPAINDSRNDAANVAAFCRQIPRVLVNVIPYNPGHTPITRAPTEEEVETFIGWLREEGLPVRRRATKGRSVMAACGQLGNVKLCEHKQSLRVLAQRER